MVPTPKAEPTAAVSCADDLSSWSTTDANGAEVPVVPALTCENAIDAANIVLPAMAGRVTSIEFDYGSYCAATWRCAATSLNKGTVIYDLEGGSKVWVSVWVDNGRIRGTYEGAYPPA